MGKFINLQTFVEPETTLFQQEVDVVLAIVNQVLTSLQLCPKRGTFILDGQKMGEDAKCILRFNWEEGTYQPLSSERTSDQIAADSIDRILSWPEYLTYGYQGEAKYFGLLPSNIYRYGRMQVLVINATYGRFLISFCADFTDERWDESTVLMMALAEAFAQMGQEDGILLRSADRICQGAGETEKTAIALVQGLFRDCTLPALETWKSWHAPANASGELTLFFE